MFSDYKDRNFLLRNCCFYPIFFGGTFIHDFKLKKYEKNILVFLCLCSTFTYAQKPVLKAGSLISIENKKEIRAKNVNVGDLVAFDVSEDIKVGDSIVISKGAKAYAKVLVAKKSGIAGTKGKLKVEWLYCVANNNTKVPLEGEIDFSRKNHTSGAVVAGTIVAAPLIFLTGQHAAIPAGYTNVTTVKIDTEL